MAKCFVLGGLILNFVGVILLYFGVRPNKSGVSATSVGDGGKVETDYFPRFNYLLLRLGLAWPARGDRSSDGGGLSQYDSMLI